MSDFQIGAAFRIGVDQFRESWLASLFLALTSFVAVVALIVILSFGFFSGIDMFDAMQTGIAGPFGFVALLLFVLFSVLAYCAAVMAIFRHAIDGYRADFVTSLAYGWKATFPVTAVILLIYLALILMVGAIFILIALILGGSMSSFEDALDFQDLSPALVIFAAIIYFSAFVLIGLFVPARFGLAGPVMAAQRRLNPFWAMGRSWTITRGSSLKLMGYLFLFSLAWLVLYLLLALLSAGLSASGFGYVGSLISYFFTLFIAILYNMIISGIYVQFSGDALMAEERIEDVFG